MPQCLVSPHLSFGRKHDPFARCGYRNPTRLGPRERRQALVCVLNKIGARETFNRLNARWLWALAVHPGTALVDVLKEDRDWVGIKNFFIPQFRSNATIR